jgi:hypothetical protein
MSVHKIQEKVKIRLTGRPLAKSRCEQQLESYVCIGRFIAPARRDFRSWPLLVENRFLGDL